MNEKPEEQRVEAILPRIESYFMNKKHPKDLYENIRNMTKKEFQEIMRKDYSKPNRNNSNSKSKLKYQPSWNNPGLINGELAPIESLKPKVLSYWDMIKSNMSERSYEFYPVEFAWKLVSTIPKEFGNKENLDGFNEHFREHLIKHKIKFQVNYFI